MTPWELAACVDGYNKANGGEEPLEPPSSEEFSDMLERHRWVATATRH